MCNLTVLPPHRPAAKRHKCGTSAAPQRSRTGKSAPPQRTKVSIIRYLCAPNCGTFLGAGTASLRLCPFFAIRTAQNWLTHLRKRVLWTTWLMHNFSCPKLHLGLPFSLPGPARQAFPFPKCNSGSSSHLGAQSHPIGLTQLPKAGCAALSRRTDLLDFLANLKYLLLMLILPVSGTPSPAPT